MTLNAFINFRKLVVSLVALMGLFLSLATYIMSQQAVDESDMRLQFLYALSIIGTLIWVLVSLWADHRWEQTKKRLQIDMELS